MRKKSKKKATSMSAECNDLTAQMIALLHDVSLDVGVSVMATLLANALATVPEEIGETVLRNMRLIMASPPEGGRWN
jgi:hypothetical protein